MIVALIRRLFLIFISLIVLTMMSYWIMLKDPLNQVLFGSSLIEGYFSYIKQLLTGDFGITYVGGELLRDQILAVLPSTLELCVAALILALLFGIPLGFLGALNRGTVGTVIRGISSVGLSIPVYWIGSILLYLAAIYNWEISSVGQYNALYEIKPITGFAIIDVWFVEEPYRIKIVQSVLQHLALPTLVLMITPVMEIIRLTQYRAEQVVSANYTKSALIRGWSKMKVLRVYLLRNTLGPILPQIIRTFTLTLASCMLIENIFNWSGIGQWLIAALSEQDYNAVAIGVMVIGVIVLFINLLADLSEFLLDPYKKKAWYD
ncbi:ABC transporter permease [Gallibacterium sp. AGMB14963]|uniref:ABC transporter permease n=1 Tax=Gallibacterium faecale TaxID=3019086 RepID=UPI0022F1A104|nr:ABC transporter permease subunit [Gallibacterium sp. AGMB14963]MDA3978624.1 ABC transporter permease subunit [Gallibacterium sp. AGMB14963]